MIALFPGSFCPPTVGHLDIIERASKLCDKLYVVVGFNAEKTYSISAQTRVDLLKKCTKHLKNVEIVAFDGFMTDFCQQVSATVMIKSVRNEEDLETAFVTNQVNNQFWKGGELILLASNQKYQSVSSSLVRELAFYGKSLSGYVPNEICQDVEKLLKK